MNRLILDYFDNLNYRFISKEFSKIIKNDFIYDVENSKQFRDFILTEDYILNNIHEIKAYDIYDFFPKFKNLEKIYQNHSNNWYCEMLTGVDNRSIDIVRNITSLKSLHITINKGEFSFENFKYIIQ